MFERPTTRRKFIEFMGRSSVLAVGSGGIVFHLSGCGDDQKPNPVPGAGEELRKNSQRVPFESLPPKVSDYIELTSGFTQSVVVEWGQSLGFGRKFGFNNDFTQFIPMPDLPNEGLLWVNHESVDPRFVTGWNGETERLRSDVLTEEKMVGGSVVHLYRDPNIGTWKVRKNSKFNYRLDARSKISFAGGVEVKGSSFALGTLANCGGGKTPWGTIVSCEENYDNYVGERNFGETQIDFEEAELGWQQFSERPPEHYGWVMEVDPWTGSAIKHTSMGRFSHENAAFREFDGGRVAVYMGDDSKNECLYKFVSDNKGSLLNGTLYVAQFEEKRWIPLDIERSPILKEKFSNQLDVMIYTREASRLVGGSPLDRPEDVEVDPVTGNVFVAFTNNRKKGNFFGSICKIVEKGGAADALEFEHSTFLSGGEDAGFACPDNLCFDPRGNLWITTDVSGSRMNRDPYVKFGNNSLFYVPLSGPEEGKVFRVASAPMDAEFTGPSFAPDGSTLFLSVQHPGEESESLRKLRSRWPHRDSVPKPAVVAIQGESLEQILKKPE